MKKAQKHYYGESGYLQLLKDVLEFGSSLPDRTGVGRRKLSGCTLTFDMRDGYPAVTHRSTPPRIAFEEFWGFLKGRCDIHTYLSEKEINIWEGNTTREFLDKRGLSNLPVGHGGKAYGFQYRNFNGDYDDNFMPTGGVDQIWNTYNELINNSFNSRLITMIWNPSQEREMTLPPCWYGNQFVVTLDENGDKLLNLIVNSRSADCCYGLPFNWQQFSLYLIAMAEATGMIAGELTCMLADAHIYGLLEDLDRDCKDNNSASQMKFVKETLTREFFEDRVDVKLKKPINSFDDLINLQFTDFEFTGLKVNKEKYVALKPSMAV